MGEYVVKLPDVGEGIAEAEIVEWHVNVGDTIAEDQVMVEVMTDKATVELPSPVAGIVASVGAAVGDVLAVGSPLIRIETDWRHDEQATTPTPAPADADAPPLPPTAAARDPSAATASRRLAPSDRGRRSRATPRRTAAAPAVRQRAATPRHRPWPTSPAPGPTVGSSHADLDAHLDPSRPSPHADVARRGRGRADDTRRRRAGRGPATQHRPADADRQDTHPALHLRRGGRRHRGRTTARRAQRAHGRRRSRS